MVSAADLPIIVLKNKEECKPSVYPSIPLPTAEHIAPAIVLNGTTVMLRLEHSDTIKVERKVGTYLHTNIEHVPEPEGTKEPFYRMKASREGALVAFDTRCCNSEWLPIPLALFGGTILVGKPREFVFQMSQKTTCKIVSVSSRQYPTSSAYKFTVVNFEPSERLFKVMKEMFNNSLSNDSAQAPAVTDAEFAEGTFNTIINNPKHQLNQLGGGIILINAPSNTIRVDIAHDEEINVKEADIVAWTPVARFISRRKWLFCSVELVSIRGPCTVWISAKRTVVREVRATQMGLN